MIFFSVIIPTYNRINDLKLCLHKISKSLSNFKSDSAEIIVSIDGEINAGVFSEFQSYDWVVWLIGPSKGPAANRNNGAKYAKGKWLIFIDDDVIPDEWLLNAYYNSIISGGSGCAEVYEGRTIANGPKTAFNQESPVNDKGGFLWSCNFCISKSLFDLLGGFDENFPYPAMEDVDLHYRIKKSGNNIIFVNEALVVHPWRMQLSLYTITKKRYESICYFLEKFPEKRNELNKSYFFRCFIHSFFVDNFKYILKYRARGFWQKLQYDYLLLKYSFNHK